IHRALSIKSVRKYIKDSPYASDAPLVVDQNELWDFDIQLYQDILVETGNTLTITCRVAMPEQAKIIVEPGAKLIIDGGVVTTFCENTFWQGIEVWGNHNLPQTEANQGVVELKNDGIIEYARNGIRAIKRLSSGYDWSKTGGIVRCMSGTFKDCRRGIDNV
ncbi:MAG: hypothetical protein JJT77_13810, partial [Crocinitomicaceae bacterium]|nr:hypothetical protein [Crocinitomicaceae bacterium]